MQMYALARNTSSNVVKRTVVSLINAHCLASLADLVVDWEWCVVDSALKFIVFIESPPSGPRSELPGIAPELLVELDPDGRAVYAI